MQIDYAPATNEFSIVFGWRPRLMGMYKEPVMPLELRDYIVSTFGNNARYDEQLNTYYISAEAYKGIQRLRNRFNLGCSMDAMQALSCMGRIRTHKSAGAHLDYVNKKFYVYPGSGHAAGAQVMRWLYGANPKYVEQRERMPDGQEYTISCIEVHAQHIAILDQLREKMALPLTPAAERAMGRYKEHAAPVNKQATTGSLGNIKATLKPHQADAINRIFIRQDMRHPYGRILADEPGMGKTLIALAAMVRAESKRPLVIVPKSLQQQWLDEASEHAGARFHVLTGPNVRRLSQEVLPEQPYIVSYNLMPLVAEHLGKRFDAIVADEAHLLKRSNGVWHQAFVHLAQVSQAELVLLMTGTPIYNNPEDLDGMLHLLGAEDVYQQEASRAANGSMTWSSHEYVLQRQASHGDVGIPDAMYQTVLIRRQREDADLGLPPKERRQINLAIEHPTQRFKASYQRFKGYQTFLKGSHGATNPQATQQRMLERMTAFRRDLSAEKLRVCGRHISELARTGRRILVFCEFVPTANQIAEQLQAPAITGQTPSDERRQIFDGCRAGHHQVLVLTLGTASAGLNLQMFTHVVFVDIPWTHSQREQAESRAHRSGQKHAVYCDYLISHAFDRTVYAQGEAQHEVNEKFLLRVAQEPV